MDDPPKRSDDYRPRRDDHLVEPMLAGLGVGEEDDERQVVEELLVEEDEAGIFVRLVRVVRRVTRRRPRASGPGR